MKTKINKQHDHSKSVQIWIYCLIFIAFFMGTLKTNAQCNIYSDTYSSTVGWTQVGTGSPTSPGVYIGSNPGRVNFNQVFGQTDFRVYHSIPQLGTTSWTANFKFSATSGSGSPNAGVAADLFCLSSEHLTPTNDPSSMNGIYVTIGGILNPADYHNETFIYLSYKIGASSVSKSTGIHFPNNGWGLTYYVSLRRICRIVELRIFSDSTLTNQISGSPNQITIPAAFNLTGSGGNTFLQHANQFAAGSGRCFTGWVDNTCINSYAPGSPIITSLTIDNLIRPCCPILNVSGQNHLAFNWTGPNSYTSTTQNPCDGTLIGTDGTYSVTVIDGNGCTATSSIARSCLACPGDPCNYWAVGGNNANNGGHIDGTYNLWNIIGINDVGVDGSVPPTVSQINLSPLRIFTNSTEKMRILSNGNTGIGTTNPFTKLEISGDLLINQPDHTGGGRGLLLTSEVSSTHYSWKIGAESGLHSCLEITPSSTPGGNTFTNPILEIYQSGKFRLNGTPHCSGHPFWLSDFKIKQNITNVTNALTTINQLNPVKFDFKVTDFPYLNLSSKRQIGFISQDVQNVLPYLVDSVNYAAILDSNGSIIRPASTFLSLGMSGIIPIAIAGIQELDSIVAQISASSVKKSCSLNVNYLTKATGLDAVCNSLVYDNGTGIGIGTSIVPAGYKMVVEGKAGFLDVIVKSASMSWPDYVFEGKHALKPIEEVENFVTTNKHLPGIPSQGEIEKAGGVNVGEMQSKQMEKIEELYLYIIEMNKSMQKISLENQELKERVKTLENK